MDTTILALSLAAGLVAALNPCGFAMLPAYLALVVAGESGEYGRMAAVGRAMAATATMALGFLAVFGTFGLVIAPLAAQAQQYMPAVTVVVGVLLLGLGAWMLAGREITLLLPKPGKGAPSARLGSMFGYGLAYAIASLSCTIGPFLAVTSTTFRTGSILSGVLAYLAYATGMALTVGVLATAVALAGATVAARAKRVLPYVNRVGGGLLMLVGLYVGYYGVYELRLYFADGDARDPVVQAAGRFQQTLATLVDNIGALPLAGLLVVLGGGAVAFGRLRARWAKDPAEQEDEHQEQRPNQPH